MKIVQQTLWEREVELLNAADSDNLRRLERRQADAGKRTPDLRPPALTAADITWFRQRAAASQN